MADTPATIRALQARTAQQLASVVPDADREARDLLASLHDAPRSWATQHADDAPLDLLLDRADEAVARRCAGAPLAYATRRAAFRHLFLHVDQRVLIPRPETEELVSLALPHIAHGATVADIGTGSGAIALALATESGAAHVIATDISADALAVAELNARAVLRPDDARVEFRLGNLLESFGARTVDVLVSNPPYIATGEAQALDDSVREWEPPLALFGGASGMDVIAALAMQAATVVVPGGVVLLEVDARRAAEAAACFAPPLWRDVAVVRDAFGRDRFIRAFRNTGQAGTVGSQ